MPPAVFGQMLRNAAEPMRRLLLATGTTTPPGIPRDQAADHPAHAQPGSSVAGAPSHAAPPPVSPPVPPPSPPPASPPVPPPPAPPDLDSLLEQERRRLAELKETGAPPAAVPAPPPLPPPPPPPASLSTPQPTQASPASQAEQWGRFRQQYLTVAQSRARGNPELLTVRGGASIAVVLEEVPVFQPPALVSAVLSEERWATDDRADGGWRASDEVL